MNSKIFSCFSSLFVKIMYFIKEIFQKVAVSKTLLVIVIFITETKASKDENEEQEESYIDAR